MDHTTNPRNESDTAPGSTPEDGSPGIGWYGAAGPTDPWRRATPGEQPTTPIWPSPASPPPSRRKRAVATTAAVGVLAGLLGGAAGAGIVQATDGGGRSTATSSLTETGRQSDSGNDTASGPAGTIEQVAQKVLPSVVSVSVQGAGGTGTGTGVIISSDGEILTNNHVVEGAANGGRIVVDFQDGSSAEATVVGLDPLMDLAVIKADKSGLTPAELGDSAELNVGDQVVAFGSPLGLAGTVTSGIVSALQRPVRTDSADPTTNTVIDAIQTDAAINPGNSGGPLVDVQGRVVGINTAIASLGSAAGGQAGSIGLGFAIPINQVREIAKELIDTGTATHARLGVSVGDVRETDRLQSGALIREVEPGGAAEQAGIQPGDLVVKLEDRVIKDADGLVAGVRSHRPGDKVTIVVERNNDQQTFDVTLGSDANARTS
jgi:putative serine protease PepD